MKDIYELKEEYLEQMKIINRSNGTIKAHRFYIGKLIEFLRNYPVNDVTDITHDHLYEYQRYRHYRENRYGRTDQPGAQNRHIAAMKGLFNYLKEAGYIIKDPSEEIQYAKEPKRLPKDALTNKEMKKLMRSPDINTVLGYRNRTILELLYTSGIRKQELLNLKLNDIDYEGGFLRVNSGKGDKDRVTPIGKISCRYLETYIKGIRPILLGTRQEEEGLFISKRGNKISRNALGDAILRHAKQSNIKKHITTHTFRRSCATEMIRNKANIMHVKEILGHSSMDTVQRYCDLTITDIKEAHRKHHPREKDEN